MVSAGGRPWADAEVAGCGGRLRRTDPTGAEDEAGVGAAPVVGGRAAVPTDGGTSDGAELSAATGAGGVATRGATVRDVANT